MIEKATAFPVPDEDLVFWANVNNATNMLFSTKKKYEVTELYFFLMNVHKDKSKISQA